MSLIFLDRDGVLNQFPGKNLYVTREEQMILLPGAAQAVRRLTVARYEVIVISNQGCVSGGLVTEEGLRRITEKMLNEIEEAGGRITSVLYCIHQTNDACDCKKPKTGLFDRALAGRRVESNGIFFIGDSEEDVEAGKNARLRTILVLSGKTSPQDVQNFSTPPEVVKRDLLDAVTWILGQKS